MFDCNDIEVSCTKVNDNIFDKHISNYTDHVLSSLVSGYLNSSKKGMVVCLCQSML